MLRSCSAVVGMHPDAATEAIVDFALATNKPFAVVPCCVWSVDFPLRRDGRGRPVRTLDEFVAYLAAKAPGRIATHVLPFEGKNTVVYSVPDPTGSAPPGQPAPEEQDAEHLPLPAHGRCEPCFAGGDAGLLVA